MKSLYTRLLLLFTLIISSVYILTPTFFETIKGKKLSLGLDLQGGVYIVLGIDFPKVFEEEFKKQCYQLEQDLKKQGIQSSIIRESFDTALVKNFSKDKLPLYFQKVFRSEEIGSDLKIILKDSIKNEFQESALTRSIEVLRTRVDQFGVSEPEITSLGNDKIIVQLPGLQDIERAKNLIGQTAKLSFHIVAKDQKQIELLKKFPKEENLSYQKYVEFINKELQDKIPPLSKIVFEKSKGTLNGFIVEEALLYGNDLDQAGVSIDPQSNLPAVSLSFNPSGSKKMADLTSKNIGRLMAIVLDDQIFSIAGLQSAITGGSAIITNKNGTYEDLLKQSKDLALVLKAGALPVKLDIIEERLVGPTLGSDAVNSAQTAAFLSCFLVFIFLLIYYKTSGFISVLCLSLNALFILATLVLLGATLTLPGIAGLALTIGMAVDANIILFERIKQELQEGQSFKKATAISFEKSFFTILDANLTTIIAGLTLLTFGTGPLKGFAVTLISGILINVYACYFVSKLFFDVLLTKKNEISL